MLLKLFLLFTLLPMVELSLLVWLGGKTVWWLPVMLVVLTALAGAALTRIQGWHVVRRIQGELRSGRLPAAALLDGVLILLAAVLLITPGVITDVVGLLLLLPPVRNGVKRVMFANLREHVRTAAVRGHRPAEYAATGRPAAATGHDTIIDAQVVRTRVEDA